jgi:hypothetical protein
MQGADMNIVSQSSTSLTAIESLPGAISEQGASDTSSQVHALLMHKQLLLQAAIAFGMPQILCEELTAEIDQLLCS